jgi:hypothetical protein
VLSGRGGGYLRYWKGVGGLEALLRNECGGEVKQGKDQVMISRSVRQWKVWLFGLPKFGHVT